MFRTEYRTIKGQKAAYNTEMSRPAPAFCLFIHQRGAAAQRRTGALQPAALGKRDALPVADHQMIQHPHLDQRQRLHQSIGDLPVCR